MKLSILKCHGSGNDFILIDETAEENNNIQDSNRVDLTRTLCNREAGIGADGVLFYLSSESADCRMRMFNPDGGEAEMCGNGLRCVGRYCLEKSVKQKVSVETMKSILSVKRENQLFDGVETFEAEIGPISFVPSSLPMITDFETFIDKRIDGLSDSLMFTALSVPNPHIITIVDEIDEDIVKQHGIAANNFPVFPNGVNVSFVKLLEQNRIFVVTYERGVGITYSCGTAMSASACVCVLRNLVDSGKPIVVYNKGGIVECSISNVGANILLKGNATFVFEATVDVGEDCKSIQGKYEQDVRLDEIDAYGNLQRHAKSVIAV
uniref:Diaminopimelate epimerase n=1 Tax=Candidatus Kentrum sp. TUN TaxID=2126343 RepID=A0A451ANP0_9GAMM|nr:MAG: diaminopimelate epimerase [Candidatus Kentron sp. TUN]VFK67647.1 MAG: diaminopimelate epimerase [Candidatus Kentron sp. TUN]